MIALACEPDTRSEISSSNFQGFRPPAHFPPPVYQTGQNPVTEEGFVLGRSLFYERKLSKDATISCADCHRQSAAFSDAGKTFSQGAGQKTGRRNTPALANLAWHTTFMWDGGVNHIEVMPVAPITDSLEMGHNLKDIISILHTDEKYPALFEKAFGSSDITSQRLLLALAQFMTMMISDNSRFDQHQRKEISFTAKERRGYNLFKMNCASCHSGPLQTDFSYRNNGLSGTDEGRYRITHRESDRGKFKVPSLRNISHSPPYMHDGRFETLREVLNHYTSNLESITNIDSSLTQPVILDLQEREDLLTFLEALTDYEYLTSDNFVEAQ